MGSKENSNTAPARLYPGQKSVRAHMLDGRIGLELETQRIDRRGHLALTPHPFKTGSLIDRDFGEAQIEINTPPASGAEETEMFLHGQLQIAQTKLKERGELLWPFSGPPAIGSDSEIRIAEYFGDARKKTIYRKYLAAKYGRRIMTLCGIHFNYSFSETVLENSFVCSGAGDYRAFKDTLYLQLAEKVLSYSWVIVALLSASPLADSSFSAGSPEGGTVFTGYSSLRCSREGYWNLFDPVLSYDTVASYTESIGKYKEEGLLRHEGELYYPVRIKPAGKYSLRTLDSDGVSHIELRMIDLNPLTTNGIDRRDLRFLQMFLVWLASRDAESLDAEGQKNALETLKASAQYDWDDITIRTAEGKIKKLQQALEDVLAEMAQLFSGTGQVWQEALQHQAAKVRWPEKRYARQVRSIYGENYLAEGLKRAEQLQEELALHI